MANTIQQAEAELRVAALEYVAKNNVYHSACDVERERLGGWKQFNECGHENHAEEWQRACRAVNAAQYALCDAATALADALASESRAEAL